MTTIFLDVELYKKSLATHQGVEFGLVETSAGTRFAIIALSTNAPGSVDSPFGAWVSMLHTAKRGPIEPTEN